MKLVADGFILQRSALRCVAGAPSAFIAVWLLAVPTLAEPFTEAMAEECGRLWRERNAIFVERGLCLESPLAGMVFGDRVCDTSDPNDLVLDETTRGLVTAMRRHEVYLGCIIDTAAETLADAARSLMVDPGETGIIIDTPDAPANVRSAPSAQGTEIVDRLENGTRVTVRARLLNPLKSHRWLRIAYDRNGTPREGYIYFPRVQSEPVAAKPTDAAAALDPALPENIATIMATMEFELAREALKPLLATGEPNFAGTAFLAQWGCGSGCAAAGVLDPAADVWFQLPFVMHRDLDQEEPLFSFRQDSPLIVATGWRNEDELGRFEYRWNGRRLDRLSEGMAEMIETQELPQPMNEFETRAAPTLDMLDAVFDYLD